MTTTPDNERLKQEVRDHWNKESCGERYVAPDTGFDLSTQEKERYALEPFIFDFAKFDSAQDKDVLEVGVGMGADHRMWALASPKSLSGIDLTSRGINFTTARLAKDGLVSNLQVADAENLPFPDQSFDIVYSWGVMHHSPNTQKCFGEAFRVLRPGGIVRIMIYNTWSLVGLMLWARYGLLKGRPQRSLSDIYHQYLESPGTKAYTPRQAADMIRAAGFAGVKTRVQLSHGDLLEGQVGARHKGPVLRIASALWPRALLKGVGGGMGLYLLIEAQK